MARIDVATQAITRDGLDPAMTAPIADGDIIDVGRLALVVDNGGASSITVTVQTPLQVDGLDVEELAVAVPAGEQRWIGPLPSRLFARAVGEVDAGRAYVDYTGTLTSVTRAVVSI